MVTSANGFVVRDASEHDGARLLDLMRGATTADSVRWSIEPGNDPFAALRAESDGWTVALAEDRGERLLGFVSVASRMVYVQGIRVRSCYVTNLKVLTEHRGRGIGDALCWHAVELCRRIGGDSVPILMVIRDGNASMRGRVSGPRGLPRLAKFATVEVHSVPVRRAASVRSPGHLAVSCATREDLEEMTALSSSLAGERHFAPGFDAAGLARRIDGAPGLDIADYMVARSSGRIVGWMGWWDEAAVRVVTIAGFTAAGAARRAIQSAAARMVGTASPAAVGDRVGCLRAVHACVPRARADVLRALLAETARRRAHDCSWLKVALDVRDPLGGALTGMRTHVARFDARLTTPSGGFDGSHLHDRPLHLDAALI